MRWDIPLLIAFTLLFSLGYLDLLSKWWYEDDPIQFHYVMQIADPVSIFTQPELLRNYGAGKALAPMQLLSYWIDVRLFGADPRAAYAHNLAALLLTVIIIQALLRRWTGNSCVATSAAVLWLLLPATLAVHYYIAARHYMEGLLSALLMVYCTGNLLAGARQRRALWLFGVVLFAAVSVLFKEIYATAVPAYVTAIALHRRKTGLLLIPIGLGVGYVAYRLSVQGTGISYAMPLLGVYDYARSVLALPYTLTASYGGYALVAGFLFIVVKLWQSSATGSAIRSATQLALLLLAAALVATYPVAYAMLTGYKIPDTSYRMPFVVSTILLMWAAYLLPQYLSRRQILFAAAMTLLVVVPGTDRTRGLWTQRMARTEAEGKFYLSNPDKLLYSEEDAFWFIIGVHRLYNVEGEHYINKQFRVGPTERTRLEKYSQIWSYQNGTIAPNTQLLEDLRQENQRAGRQ